MRCAEKRSKTPTRRAQSRLGKHAGSCADRLVLYARGSAGVLHRGRTGCWGGTSVRWESWGWTPAVPVRSSGLRQRACRAELVALWVLHDGPGARVLEGIRVRAGPRASAFAVASANRPGDHPAATSTSAFRQIVVSPVRCRAAVAVACDRRGARMVALSARLTLLLNPGSLASWRLKWFAVRLGAQRTTACCIAYRAAARVDTPFFISVRMFRNDICGTDSGTA
jgi:hypothetical protein